MSETRSALRDRVDDLVSNLVQYRSIIPSNDVSTSDPVVESLARWMTERANLTLSDLEKVVYSLDACPVFSVQVPTQSIEVKMDLDGLSSTVRYLLRADVVHDWTLWKPFDVRRLWKNPDRPLWCPLWVQRTESNDE